MENSNSTNTRRFNELAQVAHTWSMFQNLTFPKDLCLAFSEKETSIKIGVFHGSIQILSFDAIKYESNHWNFFLVTMEPWYVMRCKKPQHPREMDLLSETNCEPQTKFRATVWLDTDKLREARSVFRPYLDRTDVRVFAITTFCRGKEQTDCSFNWLWIV